MKAGRPIQGWTKFKAVHTMPEKATEDTKIVEMLTHNPTKMLFKSRVSKCGQIVKTFIKQKTKNMDCWRVHHKVVVGVD